MSGTDTFSDGKCPLQRKMRDMPASSHAIDYEVVKSFEFAEFLFRNMVHVCAVCNVSETETKDRKTEMPSSDRNDFNSIDPERPFIYDMDIPVRSSRVLVFLKCI